MFQEIPRDPKGKLVKLSKVLTLEKHFVSPKDPKGSQVIQIKI